MHTWTIRVETTTITNIVTWKILLLGNQVDNVETETIDTFVCPEADDFFHFFTHYWVFPV